MLYLIDKILAKIIFKIFTRYEVIGRENLPRRGPLLLVFNHLSHFDPPLIIALVPWRMTGIAVEGLRRVPVTGLLLSMAGVIWLRRGEYDRGSLRRALAILEKGGVLGIAPEGGISKSGILERGKTGPAFFARRANVPILPVVVTGTEKLLSELRRLRRPRLRMVIGQAFSLDQNLQGGSRRTQLQADADFIMRKLAALLSPEYRGVYAGVGD